MGTYFSRMRLALLILITVCSVGFAERGGGGAGKGKWLTTLYGGFSFPQPRFVNGDGEVQGYPGISFGLGLEAVLMPMIGVKVDFIYANKGYELQSDVLYRYPASYFTVPVQLSFNPTDFVSFHAGPYLASLILSAERQGSGRIIPATGMFTADFGMTFGLWLGFRATNKLKIGVDLRYDLGLADIQNDAFPESKLYSRTMSGLMTFTFNF